MTQYNTVSIRDANRSASYFLESCSNNWEWNYPSSLNFWDSEFDFWQWSFPVVTDFSNCRFNGTANFEDSKFHKPANFGYSRYNGTAIFENSQFNDSVYFGHSKFNRSAKFGGSKFNVLADFSNSEFNEPLRSPEFNHTLNIMYWISQISADFWSSKFEGPANFGNTKFIGGAFFEKAQFTGPVDFFNSTFNGMVYFGNSEFNGPVNFGFSKFNGTFNSTKFKGTGYFLFSNFNRPVDIWYWNSQFTTYFRGSKFNGLANFRNSLFNNTVTFENSNFNGTADFGGSRFNESANFIDALFYKDTNFNDVVFVGITSFNSSRFLGDALFLNTTFSDILYLTNARYDKFYVRWENIKKLGYDEISYRSLVNNFRKLGVFTDANNCYYKFRKEQLLQKNPIMNPITYIFNIGSWIFFGYGVRPEFPLLWSIFVISAFGIFWRTILKKPEKANQEYVSVEDWLSFSATVFLSGFKLLVNPPEVPEQSGTFNRWTKRMFILERSLGALFLTLLFLAIGKMIIRG